MDVFIGSIQTFAFDYAPQDYALAYGQSMPIQQNAALFALLGVRYGGDGRTQFNLPNLQGRMMIGQGSAGGSQTYATGATGGASTATLTQQQLPAHNHTLQLTSSFSTTTKKATVQNPVANVFFGRPVDSAAGGDALPVIYVPADTVTDADKLPMSGLNVAGTVGVTGGGQPVPNISPYVAVSMCIALVGIYPSRG